MSRVRSYERRAVIEGNWTNMADRPYGHGRNFRWLELLLSVYSSLRLKKEDDDFAAGCIAIANGCVINSVQVRAASEMK